MALIALVSAKGSPGVTTLAMALAQVWPRRVLVAECDPAGGDIAAGYLGGQVDADRGLLNLTVAARRTNLAAALPSQLVALDDTGSRCLLPGLQDPALAAGLATWWDRLADLFAELGTGEAGTDVLADCGRLSDGPSADRGAAPRRHRRLGVAPLAALGRSRPGRARPAAAEHGDRRCRGQWWCWWGRAALTHRGRSPGRWTCRCTRSPTTLVPPPCSPTPHRLVGGSSRRRCCAAPEPWPMTSPAATRNGWALVVNCPLRTVSSTRVASFRRCVVTSPWLAPDQTTTSVNGHDRAERRTASTSPVAPLAPVLDFGTVRRLRHQVADRLAARLQTQPVRDPAAQRELGRALASQAVADWADQRTRTGETTVSAEHERALVEAVFAALFGLGRLQALVDDERIENIEINGCDQVWLSYADGREEPGPAVADSDEELVENLQFLAARVGQAERTFTTAHPRLHLRLYDGSAGSRRWPGPPRARRW